MTMDQRYRRNTPVQAEARVGESAASRFAGWTMHAPAERVPLVVAAPLWLLALVVHVAAHLGHFTRGAMAVAGRGGRDRRPGRRVGGGAQGLPRSKGGQQGQNRDPHPHVTGIERAVAVAVIGAWLTLAVGAGPAGWTHHMLAWSYLAGTVGGCWWLRGIPRSWVPAAAATRRPPGRCSGPSGGPWRAW